MIIKPFLEDIGPKKKQSCSLGHVCTTTIDNIDETGAMIEWWQIYVFNIHITNILWMVFQINYVFFRVIWLKEFLKT